MNFNKIKEYCDKNRISIAELAEKIGISKPGLYRSIQEKTMKVETLEKIAKELDVDIWRFFDLDPEAIFINDLEAEKKGNEMNQEVMAQMTNVIAELKGRLNNTISVVSMFFLGNELHTAGKINHEQFNFWFNSMADFILSDHKEEAFDKFQLNIKSIMPFSNKEKSMAAIKSIVMNHDQIVKPINDIFKE